MNCLQNLKTRACGGGPDDRHRFQLLAFAVQHSAGLPLRIWLLLLIPLFSLLTGCKTVRADGAVVRHYFGYTRVIVPVHASSNGNFSVMEISSTGARLWPSVGLGYFHERSEYIPLDSRIVVRVQNQQQLDEVIKTLAPITKDGLCVTTE